MCIAAPILARIIINLGDEKVFKNLFKRLYLREGFLSVIACIMGFFLVFKAIPSFAISDFREETFYSSPKGAADFLSNIEINGNMFNEYGFGGYLIWRLYPEKKVFIDGRGLEPDVYREYQNVINVNKTKPQSWDDVIKKHNITYIVIPPLFFHGEIYGLVEQLFDSEDWALIYVDHLSLIFLRNNSDNFSIIKRLEIDKRKGLNTIIIQASARAMQNPRNPYYLISLGKVFFKMGRFDDAEKAFKMAYERDPDNAILMFWMQKVQNKRKNDVKVIQ
jgi:tetratricopeptide (TPR) repeat protein